MKILKISFCFLLIIIIGGNINNVEAQTLRELEQALAQKRVKRPSPPPKNTFWKDLRDDWEDSWDDWKDDTYWGFSYSYSRQFPLSFSLQAHRHIYFMGFGMGFATNPVTYSYNSSTPDSTVSSTSIVDGVITRHYAYFNRDSAYAVTPKGLWVLIEPGLNFNFITISCGVGFWWGDAETNISSYGIGTQTSGSSSGLIINPNMMLHLPIPGTDNHMHFTFNAGYNFLLPSIGDDAIVKSLAAKGNGWRLGVGLEFKLD